MPQNDLRLTFNDFFTGWWITWNPYVDWAYVLPSGENSASGTNAETQPCFTCGPNRYDFFVGIDPTVGLQKWWGIPLTLKAPTYITVGPENFWQGGFGFPTGTTNSGGTVGNHGIWGVFTTGLTAIYSLQNWVPKNYGNWYVRGGSVLQPHKPKSKSLRVREHRPDQRKHLGWVRGHRRNLLILSNWLTAARGPDGPRAYFELSNVVRSAIDGAEGNVDDAPHSDIANSSWRSRVPPWQQLPAKGQTNR